MFMGVEMDIQKEREAFKDWFKSLNENGRTTYFLGQESKVAWEAWQAAKANAPEGFVLVNKKDLVKVLNCVTDDFLIDTDSFEEFKKIESLVQDEVNAMIEAQNPSHN